MIFKPLMELFSLISHCLMLLLCVIGPYNCWASDVTPHFQSQLSQDEFFMEKALEQAKLASQKGNHPIGCVLVKDGRLVAVGQNSVFTDGDITRHAEIDVIAKACHDLNLKSLEGYTLYSSCEPCPMCSGAIIYLKVSAVVYGASQEFVARMIPGHDNLGIRNMTNLLRQGPEVRGPVLKEATEDYLLKIITECKRKQVVE